MTGRDPPSAESPPQPRHPQRQPTSETQREGRLPSPIHLSARNGPRVPSLLSARLVTKPLRSANTSGTADLIPSSLTISTLVGFLSFFCLPPRLRFLFLVCQHPLAVAAVAVARSRAQRLLAASCIHLQLPCDQTAVRPSSRWIEPCLSERVKIERTPPSGPTT